MPFYKTPRRPQTTLEVAQRGTVFGIAPVPSPGVRARALPTDFRCDDAGAQPRAKVPEPGRLEVSQERPGRAGAGAAAAASTSRRSRPGRGAGSPDSRNLGPRGVEGEGRGEHLPPRSRGIQVGGGRRRAATWWCCRCPRPARPAREPRRPLTPAAGGGGGTEAQEAEQEASPAAAFSWGSGGRSGAAGGSPERPPRWGECAAPRVGEAPRSGVPARRPAFVSGARRGAARRALERLSGLAARVPPPLPCLPPAADCLRRAGRLWGPESEGRPGQVGSGLFSCPTPATRGPAAGARAGMNGQPGPGAGGRGVSPGSYLPGPPRAAPLPPPRFWARAASAQNLEELGREAQAGDSGWIRRPRVCYCSFSDSGEPFGGPGGAGLLVPPRSSYPFPLRIFEEGGGMLELGPTRGSWDFGRGESARQPSTPASAQVGGYLLHLTFP